MSQPSCPAPTRLPVPRTRQRCRGRLSLLQRYHADARTCRCTCAHRYRWKTTACSPCPMPARRSGTWRTPPGSSRLSCCRSTCRTIGPFHPAFRNLFNSYYNTVGDRPLRTLRHVLSRPSLDEVHAYRLYVDEAMVHLLTHGASAGGAGLVELGINHEQQHQELIVTDVKNGLVDESSAAGLSQHRVRQIRRTLQYLSAAAEVAELSRGRLLCRL